jgi:hypothetical protein
MNENFKIFIKASNTKLTTWEEELLNDVFTLISLLEEKDKALAFYADHSNWSYDYSGDGMIGDGGEIARKALNTSSNNEGD